MDTELQTITAKGTMPSMPLMSKIEALLLFI